MQVGSAYTSLEHPFKLGLASIGDPGSQACNDLAAARIERPFDAASDRDWCELIRDIAALANSGGGRILVGARLDDQEVLRRLRSYIDGELNVTVRPNNDSIGSASAILVRPATYPRCFANAGVGASSAGSADQVEVFPVGSFYFRHGDRSEPATSADMRAFAERLLRRMRRRWLRGIRRVLGAPTAALVRPAAKRATAKRKRVDAANLQPVRIVTDPNAPALHPQDVDRLYPWRQKDLLRELNARIGRRLLNSYDIQAVRRQHRLDERPDFVFNLPGAGRRYSPAAADWVMDQFAGDPEFFHNARAADQAMLKLRRQKPR